MIVTIIVMVIIFAMHNVLQGIQDPLRRQQREKTYVYVGCSLFVLLAALRYVLPGSDVSSYKDEYDSMSFMTFEEVYVERSISYVYYLLSKIFSLTKLPYHFWFGCVELLYVSAFVRIANKFSLDKILCLFIFYTIGLYSFSLYGMKQALAMALIWHGFMDMYEKKSIRSAIIVFLAYFCHKTAMVFLLAYIMAFIERFKNIYYGIIVVGSFMLVFSYTSMLGQLTDFMGDERYAGYLDVEGGYSATLFIFYIVLFSISFFAKKVKGLGDNRIILGLAATTVLSQLFAFRVASAFRLSLYFLPFLTIFISNQLKCKKNLQYLIFFICAFWVLYTTQSPYKFFWQ